MTLSLLVTRGAEWLSHRHAVTSDMACVLRISAQPSKQCLHMRFFLQDELINLQVAGRVFCRMVSLCQLVVCAVPAMR